MMQKAFQSRIYEREQQVKVKSKYEKMIEQIDSIRFSKFRNPAEIDMMSIYAIDNLDGYRGCYKSIEMQQSIEKISQQDYSIWIGIRGDGNCFYRSVIILFLLELFKEKGFDHLDSFIQKIENLKNIETDYSKGVLNTQQLQLIFIVFLYHMKILKSENKLVSMNDLIEKYNSMPEIDLAAIVICRYLIYSTFQSYKTHPTFSFFIEEQMKQKIPQMLLRYYEYAEDIIIPLASQTFQCNLQVQNLFRQSASSINVEKLLYQPFDQKSPIIMTLNVLFTKGHYESLITIQEYRNNPQFFLIKKLKQPIYQYQIPDNFYKGVLKQIELVEKSNPSQRESTSNKLTNQAQKIEVNEMKNSGSEKKEKQQPQQQKYDSKGAQETQFELVKKQQEEQEIEKENKSQNRLTEKTQQSVGKNDLQQEIKLNKKLQEDVQIKQKDQPMVKENLNQNKETQQAQKPLQQIKDNQKILEQIAKRQKEFEKKEIKINYDKNQNQEMQIVQQPSQIKNQEKEQEDMETKQPIPIQNLNQNKETQSNQQPQYNLETKQIKEPKQLKNQFCANVQQCKSYIHPYGKYFTVQSKGSPMEYLCGKCQKQFIQNNLAQQNVFQMNGKEYQFVEENSDDNKQINPMPQNQQILENKPNQEDKNNQEKTTNEHQSQSQIKYPKEINNQQNEQLNIDQTSTQKPNIQGGNTEKDETSLRNQDKQQQQQSIDEQQQIKVSKDDQQQDNQNIFDLLQQVQDEVVQIDNNKIKKQNNLPKQEDKEKAETNLANKNTQNKQKQFEEKREDQVQFQNGDQNTFQQDQKSYKEGVNKQLQVEQIDPKEQSLKYGQQSRIISPTNSILNKELERNKQNIQSLEKLTQEINKQDSKKAFQNNNKTQDQKRSEMNESSSKQIKQISKQDILNPKTNSNNETLRKKLNDQKEQIKNNLQNQQQNLQTITNKQYVCCLQEKNNHSFIVQQNGVGRYICKNCLVQDKHKFNIEGNLIEVNGQVYEIGQSLENFLQQNEIIHDQQKINQEQNRYYEEEKQLLQEKNEMRIIDSYSMEKRDCEECEKYILKYQQIRIQFRVKNEPLTIFNGLLCQNCFIILMTQISNNLQDGQSIPSQKNNNNYIIENKQIEEYLKLIEDTQIKEKRLWNIKEQEQDYQIKQMIQVEDSQLKKDEKCEECKELALIDVINLQFTTQENSNKIFNGKLCSLCFATLATQVDNSLEEGLELKSKNNKFYTINKEQIQAYNKFLKTQANKYTLYNSPQRNYSKKDNLQREYISQEVEEKQNKSNDFQIKKVNNYLTQKQNNQDLDARDNNKEILPIFQKLSKCSDCQDSVINSEQTQIQFKNGVRERIQSGLLCNKCFIKLMNQEGNNVKEGIIIDSKTRLLYTIDKQQIKRYFEITKSQQNNPNIHEKQQIVQKQFEGQIQKQKNQSNNQEQQLNQLMVEQQKQQANQKQEEEELKNQDSIQFYLNQQKIVEKLQTIPNDILTKLYRPQLKAQNKCENCDINLTRNILNIQIKFLYQKDIFQGNLCQNCFQVFVMEIPEDQNALNKLMLFKEKRYIIDKNVLDMKEREVNRQKAREEQIRHDSKKRIIQCKECKKEIQFVGQQKPSYLCDDCGKQEYQIKKLYHKPIIQEQKFLPQKLFPMFPKKEVRIIPIENVKQDKQIQNNLSNQYHFENNQFKRSPRQNKLFEQVFLKNDYQVSAYQSTIARTQQDIMLSPYQKIYKTDSIPINNLRQEGLYQKPSRPQSSSQREANLISEQARKSQGQQDQKRPSSASQKQVQYQPQVYKFPITSYYVNNPYKLYSKQ